MSIIFLIITPISHMFDVVYETYNFDKIFVYYVIKRHMDGNENMHSS